MFKSSWIFFKVRAYAQFDQDTINGVEVIRIIAARRRKVRYDNIMAILFIFTTYQLYLLVSL